MRVVDSAMTRAVKAIPGQEREALLLKMMPGMLRGADTRRLAIGSATEVGRRISLHGLVSVALGLARDDEARNELTALLSRMRARMPEMMPMMAPLMRQLMPKMMGFMMPMMAQGMPDMCSDMPRRIGETMRDNPEMASAMPEMMMRMCPRMIEALAPRLSPEKREAFAHDLLGAVVDAGDEPLGSESRNRLAARITGRGDAALESA